MNALPRLMLVTDAPRSLLPLLELASAAVAGGVDAIYLRDVRLRPDDLARLVRKLRGVIGNDVAVLVNGGAEMARAAETGLHLRERDPIPTNLGELFAVPVSAHTPVSSRVTARRDPSVRCLGMTHAGYPALIGRSVHSPEEASRSTGMDYLLAGHVYPSASKPGKRSLGLEGLRAIVSAAPCPVLAIGGITSERVAGVIQAGAHGIAVISAIAEADDPRAAAAALRSALDRALQTQDHEEHRSMSATEKETVSVLDGTAAIELTVNGKTASVPSGFTIHDFLASKKMTDAMAIVERNGEIVPRSDYGTTMLTAGDHLEVVHAVGGG